MTLIEKLLPYKKLVKHLVPLPVWERVKSWAVKKRICGIAQHKEIDAGLPWGVNLFGDVGGASGLSEASRGVAAGLQGAGAPVGVYDISADGAVIDKAAPYQINLIHTNPNQLQGLLYRLPKEQWPGRWNIGFWVWEQEKLPEEWERFLPLFDEIWTPSQFSAAAIRRSGAERVYVMPHVVEPECDPNWDRKRWGLPEDLFLVLIAFDCDSVIERKNPEGAIRAFCEAFRLGEPVGLIIKVRNLTEDAERKLRTLLAGRDHVYLLQEDYPKAAVNSLIRMSDVYLSLDRAEGFGLILAEAMYLGTPVVATDWSGNVDFMDESTACMVKAELISLEKDVLPFRRGSRWAQPDEHQAARYLRELYEKPELRRQIAQRARASVERKLSVQAVSEMIKKRMEQLHGELWKEK